MKRLDATKKAIDLIVFLKEKHGELLLYQAGGCCEGTQPQCFQKDGFYVRTNDVCIGQIEGVAFWVDKDLFTHWKNAHFTLDVMEGIGAGGFSLETPLGKTFFIQYRLFTTEELLNLAPVTYNSI